MITLKGAVYFSLAKTMKQRTLQDPQEIRKRARYVQQLPKKLLDEFYGWFLRQYGCGPEFERFVVTAEDVAIFLHPERENLVLDDTVYTDRWKFNISFLLDACSENMSNLMELQLPYMSILGEDVCTRLCQSVPNLTVLNLTEVMVLDSAMKAISTLTLKELNICKTNITDRGLRILCREESIARRSLHVLKTCGTKTSLKGHLQTLSQVEFLQDLKMDHSTCNLFAMLPLNMRNCNFALNTLQGPRRDPRQVTGCSMRLAQRTCKSVFRIKLHLVAPMQDVLDVLPDFAKLTQLELFLHYARQNIFPTLKLLKGTLKILKVKIYVSPLYNSDETLQLPHLKSLVINNEVHDEKSNIMQVTLLKSCSELENLTLYGCRGLSESVLVGVGERNSFRCLMNLTVLDANGFVVPVARFFIDLAPLIVCDVLGGVGRGERIFLENLAKPKDIKLTVR